MEPRSKGGPKDIYIGGTNAFDLWFIPEGSSSYYDHDAIRVWGMVDSSHVSKDWDAFYIPLRNGTEVNSNMHPADRCIAGVWDNMSLTFDEVDEIDTYLRCFAPWVFDKEGDKK